MQQIQRPEIIISTKDNLNILEEKYSTLKGNILFVRDDFNFCVKELLEEFQEIGKILNENQKKIFFYENLNSFNLNSIQVLNNNKTLAEELYQEITILKKSGYTIKDLEKIQSENLNVKTDVFSAYLKYELWKKENNFLDNEDLTLELLTKLSHSPKKYDYIIINNFEKITPVQFEIIKLLTKENIIISYNPLKYVSFYQKQPIDKFKKHFTNYIETRIDSTNSKQLLIEAKNEKSEYSYLVSEISKLLNSNPNLKIAITTKRHQDLKPVSDFLHRFGIEHNSSEDFLNSHIVKVILSICKIISSPKESDIEWFLVLKYFHLREESIRKILRVSKTKEKPILKLLKKDLDSLLNFEDEREILVQISKNFDEVIRLNGGKITIDNLIKQIIFIFNFYLDQDFKPENIFYLNNIIELSSQLQFLENPNLKRFLELIEISKNINLEFELNNTSNIDILQLEELKSEYDVIFLINLNERRFPTLYLRPKFDLLKLNTKENLLKKDKLLFEFVNNSSTIIHLIYVKKFSNSTTNPSEFIAQLDISKKEYDLEFDFPVNSKKQIVKDEIINKVLNFLHNEDFKRAKTEIDLLESLFSNQNSNLMKYLGDKSSSHPDYNKYKDELKGIKEAQIDFDIKSKVYSVSQLKTYQSCPKKYLYSYIYKIPTEPKHYFDFGVSAHSVFEKIIFDINKLPKDAVFAKAVSMLRKNWISKGYLDSDQEKEYFEKGVIAIRNFIDRELELQKENRSLVSQEEKFLIEVEGKKIYGIIDRVDMVNSKYQILDYKTSNSMMTKDQLKEDLQLFVYSLALKELKGKYPEKIGLWYVIFDKISEIKFEELEYEKLKMIILDVISKIEKKDFKPIPSSFSCKYCDYNKICKDSIN